jgi:hypothetical protein
MDNRAAEQWSRTAGSVCDLAKAGDEGPLHAARKTCDQWIGSFSVDRIDACGSSNTSRWPRTRGIAWAFAFQSTAASVLHSGTPQPHYIRP